METEIEFFTRKKDEIGVLLNEIQKKAVLETEGPMLLLATPGSGKTTTIIMRIGYLIEIKKIDPKKIKAITFSRTSANDMKERFGKFFPYLPMVDFSTIHSLAFEVVRDHFRQTRISYQIIEGNIDASEQEFNYADSFPLQKKVILRRLFKSISGENITDDQMDELTTYISFIKNKMIPQEKWRSVQTDIPEAEKILLAYESFKNSGTNKLLVDFDDMLTIAERIFEQDDQILQKYQNRYEYVLTDESQDTSAIQHAIIEKLAKSHLNLCVVADDDQSIYSWRGADPIYLLNFKKIYPQATVLFMEQNYRSSKNIVSLANEFIKQNKNRYEKRMFTQNEESESIHIKEFSDYIYQIKYLVQKIQEDKNLSEVAVLYRNNSSSIMLMNEFDRAGVPFYMKDADNRFFSHWVVEDILNFMRMTFTDKRPEILEKIHLKFNGYISKQQMAALKEIKNNESVFDNLLNHVSLHKYQYKQLTTSKETFRQMKGMPPLQAIHVIRDRLGYEKALEKTCDRLGFRKEYLIGILNTLEEIANTLETMEEFAQRLKYLESVLRNARTKKGLNAVTFSTFHSAKGLEFEKVYMIDLIEGVMPSSEDIKSISLMEESIRLFYVGMTRAKKFLELLIYKEKDGEKTEASQFVIDIKNKIGDRGKQETVLPTDHHHAQLKVGKVIMHKILGRGKISQIDGDTLEIRFKTGTKMISAATCFEKGLLKFE